MRPRGRRSPQDANATDAEIVRGSPRFIRHHVSGAHIHPNVRTTSHNPQWLYVDVFAGGQMKVGTASEFRKHPRVAEQGAVCALFVARSTDGYSIRALEARVSEHFHLSQAIRTSRKIEALTGPLDREKLRKSLHHFVSSIKDELNDIGSDIDGIEILEAPERMDGAGVR